MINFLKQLAYSVISKIGFKKYKIILQCRYDSDCCSGSCDGNLFGYSKGICTLKPWYCPYPEKSYLSTYDERCRCVGGCYNYANICIS